MEEKPKAQYTKTKRNLTQGVDGLCLVTLCFVWILDTVF